ncbi:hypothetical protein KSS92_08045 [Pseudomonas atacamensis]|uniref:DUF6311 domain-containing protein n=1 Tax=Pseudomonas atacamensis TaxID=2565368 RepID=UPI001C3D69F4|nr:DUF6311 domain-containing protein [Pseudomonas atacamensis]QXH74442.1 hypothetical protein KSS92_08045 [Pseudomonas atacamensis]
MKAWNRSSALALLPLLLGVLAFFMVIGQRALDPQNIAWLSSGDPATHYLGWVFFRQSPWTFPLGLNPSYGMELGSAVIFSDSNPLLALLFKPFNAWLPETFQYFGLWLLVCFVLQAWFGWKLLGLITDNVIIRLLATGLLIFSPPMFVRAGGHLSLAGHFLILAALYLALHPALQRRRLAWGSLLAATALVHAYLLVMVALIWVADLLGKVMSARLSRREGLIEFAALFALVSVCCWQAGYFSIADGTGGGGFGFYRMNLLAPFDSDGWSQVLPDIRMAGGDYEGFNYFGLGVLMLLPVVAVAGLRGKISPRAALGKRLWLVAAMIGLTLFALSHHIGVGTQTFSYPLPSVVERLASIFRASGRMFWPVFYAIELFLVYLLVRSFRAPVAIGLLALVLVVQVADTRNGWAGLRASRMVTPASDWASPMHNPFWNSAAAHYKNVRGLLPQNQSERWQAIAGFAGAHGLKTDAVYMGRMSISALDEAQRVARQRLETGEYEADSLYILDDEAQALSAKSVHSDSDLLTRVDDFVVLAPGWKRCQQCPPMIDEGRALSSIALIRPGVIYMFDRKSRQLVKGWGAPEAWGTWSEGHDAEIALRVPVQAKSISIKALAFVLPPTLAQRVVVRLNGVEVLSTRLTAFQGNSLEIPLNEEVRQTLPEDGAVRLELHLPDAVSPRSLGVSDDARVMGLGVESVSVQ